MFRLIRFGVKAGIVSSAVYVTVDQGVWSSSDCTAEVYGKLSKTVQPYISSSVKEIPVEMPQVPRTEDLVIWAQNTWNRGVMTSFRFLGDLPSNSSRWVQEYSKIAYDKINEGLNQSPTEKPNP